MPTKRVRRAIVLEFARGTGEFAAGQIDFEVWATEEDGSLQGVLKKESESLDPAKAADVLGTVTSDALTTLDRTAAALRALADDLTKRGR